MAQVALLAVSVALAGASARKQRQAAKAQRREQRIARRAAEVRNRRERLQAVERRRLQEAQIKSEAEATGAGIQSSAAQGALGALGSQFGSEIGFQQDLESFNAARFRESQRAARATESAAFLQAGSSIFGDLSSAAGTFGAFTPQKPKTTSSGGA